ncbi:hypothetical protein HL653_00085 [Sphingomonas sp. AP4-R1]|uniref:hypothetical protein n=1 Tax=Sphingomonas sp. AP4-R1 TaxID=2735134 RepID=UPI001493AD6F|nr:hypothetical protein [Sphingomonas sp. AP4-R1]QJU56390.1 hypothetical protein HL653_00085 [Sphingomonas sp. AP4-R1]
MIPLRWIFRSRWAALVWAGGICFSAVQFAGGDHAKVDAGQSADSAKAIASALNAEDPE